MLLEERKNHVLSGARSEINLQEFRVESADRALHESGLQLHSQRNSSKRISYHSRREKDWQCTELERRERVLQEDCVGNLQEMEEFKKLCCTEAERAKQLRIDERSVQDKESQSTVNQRAVQIQELQDKVNSLDDSMDFHDPETDSSSGLSHVPSHLVIVPSPRGMPGRDSCLQPDTRNLYGTSGNVFVEDLLAPIEPTAACFGSARSLADTHCEPVSMNTGRSVAKIDELERNTH